MKLTKLLVEALETTPEYAVVEKIKAKIPSWMVADVQYKYGSILIDIVKSSKALFNDDWFIKQAKLKHYDTKAGLNPKDLNKDHMLTGSYKYLDQRYMTKDALAVFKEIEKLANGINVNVSGSGDYVDINSPYYKSVQNWQKGHDTALKLRRMLGKHMPKEDDKCGFGGLYGKEIIDSLGNWSLDYNFNILVDNKKLISKFNFVSEIRVGYGKNANITPEKVEKIFAECGEDPKIWKDFFKDMRDVLKYKDKLFVPTDERANVLHFYIDKFLGKFN